ncbi:MAG: hypothetical protein M3P95_02120 [Actinomycetota bacterium]|nr:hypothetical protein [Actinomycetota bacterium]
MRKRLTTIAAAGALGLGALAGGAVVVPAVASAAVSSETEAADGIAERVTAIREALAGLVSGGTITQEQADAVTQRLAEERPRFGGHRHGHGGRHLSLDTAAETLGVPENGLRDALRNGDTLADVAEREGVAVDTLVDALVAEARERLSQAVEDGRLTQAEADDKAADLEERDLHVGPGGRVVRPGPRPRGRRRRRRRRGRTAVGRGGDPGFGDEFHPGQPRAPLIHPTPSRLPPRRGAVPPAALPGPYGDGRGAVPRTAPRTRRSSRCPSSPAPGAACRASPAP